MRPLESRLRGLARRASKGDFAYLRARLGKLLWSEQRHVVLRRDLLATSPAAAARGRFTLRPLQPGDLEALSADLPAHQMPEIEKREYLLRNGLRGGHVAMLEDGRPCFIQWLLTASENALVKELFEGSLPEVDADTVLLEGAYTPPRFRRLPIMPAAMARLAEKGRDMSARWAIVCVGDDNPSMMKAAELAGFRPHELKIDRLRLFRRIVTHGEPALSG